MILKKFEFKEYMEAEKHQLGIIRKFSRPFTDGIWKYERTLRKYEYYLNRRTSFGICKTIYKLLFHY